MRNELISFRNNLSGLRRGDEGENTNSNPQKAINPVWAWWKQRTLPDKSCEPKGPAQIGSFLRLDIL